MLRVTLLLILADACVSQFTVPEVKLEAFSPKGFRASIPDTPGVQMFGFHGKRNEQLNTVEPGDFNEDVLKPVNNFWTYFNPDLELRVGDVINYWIFVQHNRLGYRKDELKFVVQDAPGIEYFGIAGTVNAPFNSDAPKFKDNLNIKPNNGFWRYYNTDLKLREGDVISYVYLVRHNGINYCSNVKKFVAQELTPQTPLQCANSMTKINNGQSVCQGTLIFEDYFNTMDKLKWIICHYMPTLGPNFEFNSYENNPEIVGIVDAKLQIKPKVRNSIRGTLDLQNGCTSKLQDECFHKSIAAFVLPPVTSGKITSNFSFKYGKVEIRAKLPKGDWIFPEIYLEPRDAQSSESKLWVAYARGNENLVGADGIDIGGKMLFAGPISKAAEPKRSQNLKSYKHVKPLSDEMHTYVLSWEPGAITAFIDNKEYGKLYPGSFGSAFDSEFVITLGVGIGGVNDFPDGYVSGNNPKPWVNKDRVQAKNFFEARNQWLPTWRGNDSALQVEYIKIYAI